MNASSRMSPVVLVLANMARFVHGPPWVPLVRQPSVVQGSPDSLTQSLPTPQVCPALSEDAGSPAGSQTGAQDPSWDQPDIHGPHPNGMTNLTPHLGHDSLAEGRVLLLQSHVYFRESWGSMSSPPPFLLVLMGTELCGRHGNSPCPQPLSQT